MTPDQPLVSVVTATWNRAELLAHTIESVLSQTYAPVEYIVVDDGSTDRTPAVLKQYGERLRAVRIDHGDDFGASAMRRGLQEAHGEFICFLDHDDLFLPGKIEAQVDALRRRPDAVAVHCGYHFADESGRLIEHTVGLPEGSYGDVLCANVVWSGGPLIRRAALLAAGGHDPSWCGDWRTWLNLLREGRTMVCVQQPLGVYRITRRSMMSSVDALERSSIDVLDEEFAHAQAPAARRAEAYGNMRMFLAGRWYAAGQGGEGARNLHEALGHQPHLQRDPARLAALLVDDATGPRTPDPVQFINLLLAHLPQRGERLAERAAALCSGALFGQACRSAAAGDVQAVHRSLTEADLADPAWRYRRRENVTAVVERALRTSGVAPHQFVDVMLDALQPLLGGDAGRIRRRAHADVDVLRMLMFPWENQSRSALFSAVLESPGWLANRGVWSVAIRRAG